MHRKANALAEFLDHRDSPDLFAEVLVRYADLREELEVLASLADQVRLLRPEGPDIAWKQRTRGRLLAWLCAVAGPRMGRRARRCWTPARMAEGGVA